MIYDKKMDNRQGLFYASFCKTVSTNVYLTNATARPHDRSMTSDWDALPDPEAQPDCATGTASAAQSATENVTNEANLDETAIIIQNKDPVGVAAPSGIGSALDNREEQPVRAEGKDESIRDILTSSPEADEILPPNLPRSP